MWDLFARLDRPNGNTIVTKIIDLHAHERHRKETKTDLRDQPAYTQAEASRYLKLPAATLRSWVVGRPYPKASGVGHSRPLIHPPKKHPLLLTFWNLIEAHVLRSLCTEHGVSIKKVREALVYAERAEKIDRLLLRKDLRTDAGKLFLDKYGELIDLSASGQLAMRKIFEEHLKRVDWDQWQFPVRLYPFVSGDTEQRPIAIDPNIAFGRPVVLRAGVSTGIIAERLDAGETVGDLTADYGLTFEEVEQAVLYERAA
ncbi:MAG: DUF433 domain-containing protein [Burkholderiales bacterium]